MKDDVNRLRAIIRACDKIEEYIDGMSYEDFVIDERTVDACAAKCTVVGNFCHEISRELKEMNPDVAWDSAYRFRCRVGHSYDTPSFDLRIMWDTLTSNIPVLSDDCARILRDLEDGTVPIRSYNRRKSRRNRFFRRSN